MTAKLPESPDLDFLRKSAKQLLRAARGGEAEALARMRAVVPRLAGRSDAAGADDLTLADAQHAIAREHGFASWARLKRQVEEQQPLEWQVERFLTAIRQRETAVAGRLLKRHPGIACANVFAASAAGAADFLAAALAADPGLAASRHEPHGWTPLVYLGASPFHAAGPAEARGWGQLRSAELLLDAGADPNSSVLFEDDPASPLPALYWACVSDNVPVVRLLLERGANPNDGESLYHAAELNHRDCLELLLQHGADLSGRHAHWNNTPLYFLSGYKEFHENCARSVDGMRWLLEHGADPNVPSYDSAEVPLHRIAAFGRGAAVAELLLAHGAEVDRPRADGRTPYVLAVRAGNMAVADLLRQRGADTGRLTPVDELLGACMTADTARAREILAAHPGLMEGLAAEDRHAFALAAEEGRAASVELMAELGFDLGWEGSWGGTPLHHAAWHGNPELVRLLLALGAPVNVRDSQFGSSPLGWAAHGSTNCRHADDDYVEVAGLLLDAGADRETSINRWQGPPESMASRRVARFLAERGFVPG